MHRTTKTTQKQHHTAVIIGPTASGKSAIAIALAKRYGGEVISADSRQIYRGLDIGTGKEPGHDATFTDAAGHTRHMYVSDDIAHHMINIVHPTTVYSAAKFVAKAQRIHKDIHARGASAIICGGTLFWAQALVEGTVFPAVPPRPDLRAALRDLSPVVLLQTLQQYDPAYAKIVDARNPARLIRAIEVATALGTVPRTTSVAPIKNPLILALSPSRDILYKRIEKRMDHWFATGIFDEIVHAHTTLRVPWVRLEQFGLEYKWCTRYVRGQVSFATMRANTLRDLKNYAKRQETWLRRWERTNPRIIRIRTMADAMCHHSHHILCHTSQKNSSS